MISHLFMNNDIYKLFHLDNSPEKQKFANGSQGKSPTSADIQPCSSTSLQFM